MSLLSGILKTKIKKILKLEHSKIIEDHGIKSSMLLLLKDFLLDTYSASFDYRNEHSVRFITFIHLFTHVPGTMLVLQIKTSQGFLVICESTARFPINNLVDRALRTILYEGLIKLHSFLLNVPRRWGWSFSLWGERNKQGPLGSHSVPPTRACWLTGALWKKREPSPGDYVAIVLLLWNTNPKSPYAPRTRGNSDNCNNCSN